MIIYMTTPDFIQGRKASARQLLPVVEEQWYRSACAGGKPDDLRRLAEYYARITGLLDSDKGPPLATVNVQFINGGIGVTRPVTASQLVHEVSGDDAQDGAFVLEDYDADAAGLPVMHAVDNILKGLL